MLLVTRNIHARLRNHIITWRALLNHKRHCIVFARLEILFIISNVHRSGRWVNWIRHIINNNFFSVIALRKRPSHLRWVGVIRRDRNNTTTRNLSGTTFNTGDNRYGAITRIVRISSLSLLRKVDFHYMMVSDATNTHT